MEDASGITTFVMGAYIVEINLMSHQKLVNLNKEWNVHLKCGNVRMADAFGWIKFVMVRTAALMTLMKIL